MKCEAVELDEQLRKYCPRSDFLIANSNLPRLFVEVNSTSVNAWPSMYPIRMLVTGASIIRFANKSVSAFREKNFAICAFFIWHYGLATRYTLFHQQGDDP